MFKLWLPAFKEEVWDKASRAYFMPIYQSFPLYMGLQLDKLPPSGSFLDDIFVWGWKLTLRALADIRNEEVVSGAKQFFKKRKNWAVDELVAVSGPDVLRYIGL